MTTDRVIRDLKDAASDAEDTINDLIRQAEDLTAERDQLQRDLVDAQDEASGLYVDNTELERKLAEALERIEAEKQAGRIL